MQQAGMEPQLAVGATQRECIFPQLAAFQILAPAFLDAADVLGLSFRQFRYLAKKYGLK